MVAWEKIVRNSRSVLYILPCAMMRDFSQVYGEWQDVWGRFGFGSEVCAPKPKVDLTSQPS